MHALQRELSVRAAARVRAARGCGAPGHRSLRPDRRASGPVAPRPRSRSAEGSVVHARSTRPASPRADLVPTGRADERGDARRGRACRAGGRAPGGEPGGVLPRRRRLPRLPRAARPRRARGRIVDEDGETVGTHAGFWRFTPGQRRGLGVSTGRPTFALGSDPATNTVVVGPRASLARRDVSASGGFRSGHAG